MYIIVVGGVVVIDINMQYAIHIIFNNYKYLQNSSVWARLTDERVARDIMRFGFGVYLTNHSREARFEGPKF